MPGAIGSQVDMNNSHPRMTIRHQRGPTGATAPSEARVLIDVPTLAEQLGVTQRFVRRLTAEDRVPFLKIGKFIRFDPLEIDDWVDSQ